MTPLKSLTPFLKALALIVLTTSSAAYLFLYAAELVSMSAMNEWQINFGLLDEVSVWFYRERGPTGQPASPYRLSPHLSVIDPQDGPNWEIRIPGWIPAIPALAFLSSATIFIFPSKLHRQVK
jgi:hypothetical protein